MKKMYLILFLLAFSGLSFGQSNNTCSTARQVTQSQFPYDYNQTDGTSAANDGLVSSCPDRMNDGLWYTEESHYLRYHPMKNVQQQRRL